MNNEEKILNLLETINGRLDKLEAGQERLEASYSKLEAGQASLVASQAKLEIGYANMDIKFDSLQREVARIKWQQAAMKETLDAVFDHTAYLTEFKTMITQKVEDIHAVTATNSFDIARLRAAR